MFRSVIPVHYLERMVSVARSVPEGCFVEVGVYLGGSAQILYEIAKKQGRKLHLFDTFTGIPFQGELDDHVVGDFGDFNAADHIRLIQHAMPEADIHVGVFPATLPDDLQNIALVHADGDQFQTTADILRFLYPRLVPGGMIIFDDYDTPMCAGCTKAVDDFVTENHLEAEFGRFKGGGRAALTSPLHTPPLPDQST